MDEAALPYVRQRSEDLTYYLFESPAPGAAVRVLAERVLQVSGARLHLAIIGSSHFLEIRSGEVVLCELLACPRPGVEAMPWRRRSADLEGPGPRLRRGGLSYRFEADRHHCSPREFEARSARLAEPGTRRLRFLFPGGDGSGSALTCLDWELAGQQAEIVTYHTFPDELTIVRTRSRIYVAPTGVQP